MGPLPPPAALEQFERIAPGSAERIIRMAESEQAHRHALESASAQTQRDAVRLTARDGLTGMILGAVIALAGIGAAFAAFWLGAPWPLAVAFLSLPVMIVAVELVRHKK